ncbi:MAG: hypothetical protein U0232_05525 [Thermomicrobiales bacterium]
MRQYNFFVMRPSYDPEKGPVLAGSPPAVGGADARAEHHGGNRLAGGSGQGTDEQLGGQQERVPGSEQERGWSTGQVAFLERPQAASQEAI